MAAAPNSTDRARAFRLRDKIAKKKPITAEQKAWLEAYERPGGGELPRWSNPTVDRKKRADVKADEATVVDSAPWRPIGVSSPGVSSPAPAPAPSSAPRDDDDDDDEHDQDDDDDEPDSGVHTTPASTTTSAPHSDVCTIENCPACAGMLDKGPQICAKTKKPVWPQISDNGARMLAGVILFAIGFGVRIAYRQPEIVDPTELELEALAGAIKDVVRKRAGWVQAIDDLLATAWGVGAYAKRARKMKALPAPKEATT